MVERPVTPPQHIQPVLIDGKKINAIKVETGADGAPFLFAVTCDMAIYYSWSIVVIKWERPCYDKNSL